MNGRLVSCVSGSGPRGAVDGRSCPLCWCEAVTGDVGRREPHYEYRPPSMAVDPFHPNERIVRALQLLRMMRQVGDTSWASKALALIERSSVTETVELLNGLADEDIPSDLFDACLTATETRRCGHGKSSPEPPVRPPNRGR